MSLPLYLYPDEDAAQRDALAPSYRAVNFDPKIHAAIRAAAGLEQSSPGRGGGPRSGGAGSGPGAALERGAARGDGAPSVSPDGLPPPVPGRI